MAKMFFEYSDTIQSNFKDGNDLRVFNKICVDTYNNTLNGQTVREGNAVILKKMYEIAGIEVAEGQKPTEKQIRKAFRSTAKREAMFEIIVDTIDNTLVTGWSNDPWFKKYVEFKTLALGQKNSFYVKGDNLILNISKISGDHHNIERQRLGHGTDFSVPVEHFGAKVYMEMVRFLMGVEDWSELIDAISRAFTIKVNRMIHEQVITAVKDLPVPSRYNRKGLATTENKANFKNLIADIKRATGAPSVVIMGTEVGLGELTGFADVQWADHEAKSDIYSFGRLGMFEGNALAELPNPFDYNMEDYLDDDNKVSPYLESDKMVIIMPSNIDQFVKFYYEGADEILEHSQRGENGDDTKDYEFQTIMGVRTLTNRRFGVWTFEA